MSAAGSSRSGCCGRRAFLVSANESAPWLRLDGRWRDGLRSRRLTNFTVLICSPEDETPHGPVSLGDAGAGRGPSARRPGLVRFTFNAMEEMAGARAWAR